MEYVIFGSESSLDVDIMVRVTEMPALEECKILSHQLQEQWAPRWERPCNINFGRVQDGQIIQVFKGTIDECNNSCLATYQFHSQEFPLFVTRPMRRDAVLKALRATRIMLSYVGRSPHRAAIKTALHSSFGEQLQYLTLNCNDLLHEVIPERNSLPDIYKTWAFQLGQIRGLIDGVELYSKESIIQQYPELAEYLLRSSRSLMSLSNFAQMTFNAMTLQFEPWFANTEQTYEYGDSFGH